MFGVIWFWIEDLNGVGLADSGAVVGAGVSVVSVIENVDGMVLEWELR